MEAVALFPAIAPMNLLTQLLHLVGSGATAYLMARNLRDRQSRPDFLAGLQLAESGSVPFLKALSDRAAAEGDAWLAERLARHAQDEERHGRIFAQALKQLNKQVIDFSNAPKATTDGKPDERRSPFFEAYFNGYSREDLKPENMDWRVFLGSTYILELDACKDFARMAAVLPDHEPDSRSLKKGILSVAQDEHGHAAYLHEAMLRRMSYDAALVLIDEWRSRKVDAMLAMVGGIIQRKGPRPSLVQDGMPAESEPETERSLEAPVELASA